MRGPARRREDAERGSRWAGLSGPTSQSITGLLGLAGPCVGIAAADRGPVQIEDLSAGRCWCWRCGMCWCAGGLLNCVLAQAEDAGGDLSAAAWSHVEMGVMGIKPLAIEGREGHRGMG